MLQKIKKALEALSAVAVTVTTAVLYLLLRREKKINHDLVVKSARDEATERENDSKQNLETLQKGVDDAEKIRLEAGRELDSQLGRFSNRPKS